MANINVRKAALVMAGLFLAILFWVFCITFTVTIISGQNKQIDDNNAHKETVTVYVEADNSVIVPDANGGQPEQTQASIEKETTNLDKYYMVDKAGNYVKGTLPYGNK